MLQLLPFETDRALTALDLGCGTGVLSHLLLRAFPKAQLISLDLSENMLTQCRARLAAFGERATFVRGDFGTTELPGGVDLVVSGLAIHHLNDDGKQALYRKIFQLLRPGGMFLNREIVLGETPHWSRRYEQMWRAHVAAGGAADDGWFQKYVDEDLPATVSAQLQWLRNAGFVDVACHWQRLNFAIFGGSKPG